MDLLIIILSISGLNFAIFSWFRSDTKAFESKIESNTKAFEAKIESWKDEIAKESRDFHGRLCALEEKYRKKENS
jgi:hypothetical protein